MQVTLGEDGSGFSNAQPLFLPVVLKKGEAWPPLRLPLVRRRRLREEESETGPPSRAARPGLSIDLEIFMEEDVERREVKQMKSSLVVVAAAVLLPVLVVRKWGLSKSMFANS